MNRLEKAASYKAFIWMIVGSLLIFSMAVVMNNYSEPPKKKEVKKSANFEVAPPPPKKKPKKKPKPKPKPKKAKSAPKAAPPSLGSAISGMDFGLPEFALGDMGEMGEGMLGDMKNVVMSEDSVDVAPKPSERAAIEYPKKARAKGITGYVVMNLLVAANGNVEQVKVLESVPAGTFDEVAIASVKAWKFEPASYQGKAVKVWAKQKIRFDLN
jgi:periplasmic protein TonB